MADTNLDPSIISVTNRAVAVASTASPRELLKISRIGPSLEQSENANLEITLNARAEDLAPTATANELRSLGMAIGNMLEPQTERIFMDWRHGFIPDQRFANGQFLRTAGSHQKSWGGVTTTTLEELELVSVATGESLVYNSTSGKFENSTNTFAITVYAAEADLPEAAQIAEPKIGSLAYVTATSEVYYFDGSEWMLVSDVYSGIYRGNWQAGVFNNFTSNHSPFANSGTIIKVDGTAATGGTTAGGDLDTTSRWASAVNDNFGNQHSPFASSGTIMMVDGTEATGGTTVGGSQDTTSRWAASHAGNSILNNFGNQHSPFAGWGTIMMVDGTEATGGTTVGGSQDTTSRWAASHAGNSILNNFGNQHSPFASSGTIMMVDGTEATGGTTVGGSVDTTNRWSSGNSKVYNLYNNYGTPSWSTTATVLEISGTEATAGTGEPIITVNSKIVVGVNNNDDAGNNSGSVYVYDLDGTNEVKITASDAAASDNFGGSVAVGENKIVVGAYNDDDGGTNSGSVYVYDLDGTNEVKITASDAKPNTNFGWSTAVGESKIVVGAYGMSPQSHFDAGNTGGGYHGAVYVYDLDGSNEVKITASDAAASDQFGYSVAVGSNKIAVSARLDDDNGESSGAVYVYDLDGSNEVKITASDASAGDQLGNKVAIGHDKIVVGAHKKDNELGAVYVYDLDGTNEVKITASDRDSLNQPSFGLRVAVGDNKIAVGSAYAPSSSNNIGAVYVYDLDGSNEVKITASDGTTGAGFGDAFGYGVGIADGKVIASAVGRDANGNVDSGAIYVYDLDGSNEIKFSPSDADSNDYAGLSIAVGSVTTSTAGSVVGGSVDTTDRWSSGNSKVYNLANGYGLPSWSTTATVIDE